MNSIRPIVFVVVAVLAQIASALTPVNSDVRDGRGPARSLSSFERASLKIDILIMRMVLNELRFKRALLASVGFRDSFPEPMVAVTLGAAVTELAAGAGVLSLDLKDTDRIYVKRIDTLYGEIEAIERQIRRQERRARELGANVVAAEDQGAELLRVQAEIRRDRQLVRETTATIARERALAPRLARALSRMTRLSALLVGGTLMLDSFGTVGFALSLDRADQIEAECERIIRLRQAALRAGSKHG